jgi:uncharacterized protein YrrD
MQLDSLRNRTVVDPDSACRTGIVTDYLVDTAAGRVATLIVRPVDVDLPQRVPAHRVACVGQHAVMLARSPEPRHAADSSTAGVPVEWLDRRHIAELVAYSDTGDRLGRIVGATIDPVTLAIQTYTLAVPLWRRWLPGRRDIQAGSVAWCGRDVLVVHTEQPAKLRPVGHEDGRYTVAA